MMTRSQIRLQGNVVLFTASQMILFSLLPYIAEQSGITLHEIILAFSFGSFLFLFSSPFWGSLSDRWGRESIITVGVLGLFVSNIFTAALLSWVSSSELLWIGRVVYGLSASAIVPITQALLLEQSPSGSHLKPLLKNSIALNIGRAVGPAYLLLSSVLFLNMSWSLWTLAIICGFALMSNIPAHNTPKPVPTPRIAIDWSSFHRTQWAALFMGFVFSTFVGVVNASLAQIFMERFEISSLEAGSLMAKVLVGSALSAVFIQLILRRSVQSPWKGLMVGGGLSLLAGALVLYFMNATSQLPVLILLLSAGLCVLPPCYIGLVAEGKTNTGFKTSLVGMISTLGYASGGGLLSVFLWGQLRAETLLIGVSIILCANIAYLHYLKSRELKYVA